MKRLLLILVALALLPASACSLRQKPTGENYYAQAQLDFATKEYKAAIENYQLVIDRFPFSPYAEDAEMKIGLAYYQQKDYAEAIGALDDFQRMHPTSKNLELVTYYIGLSYYDQIGREDQDQGKTTAALKRFQELEQRFPGLGKQVEDSMAIAIDGEIYQDAYSAPLNPDSEIVLIPKIGGG